MSTMIKHGSAQPMFKRFWERLNYWAEILDIDDPRGEYVLRLEQRVAKLERELEGLQIRSRATQVGPDEGVHPLRGHLQR
jgi:hypothetical protein